MKKALLLLLTIVFAVVVALTPTCLGQAKTEKAGKPDKRRKKAFLRITEGDTWRYEVQKGGKKTAGNMEVVKVDEKGRFWVKVTGSTVLTPKDTMIWTLGEQYLTWTWQHWSSLHWRVLKLNAKKGAAWSSPLREAGGELDILVKSKVVAVEDVQTAAGKFKGCLKVRHTPAGLGEDKAFMWWARGVGLVRVELFESGKLTASQALTSFKVGPDRGEGRSKAAKKIEDLVKKLGDEKYEAAQKELIEIGMSALPSLKEALKSRNQQVRDRAKSIIGKIEDALKFTRKGWCPTDGKCINPDMTCLNCGNPYSFAKNHMTVNHPFKTRCKRCDREITKPHILCDKCAKELDVCPGCLSKILSRKVAELLGKLGSKEFGEREEAAKGLKEIGRVAVPYLEKTLKGSDPQVRQQIEKILQVIDRISVLREQRETIKDPFLDLSLEEEVKKLSTWKYFGGVNWYADITLVTGKSEWNYHKKYFPKLPEIDFKKEIGVFVAQNPPNRGENIRIDKVVEGKTQIIVYLEPTVYGPPCPGGGNRNMRKLSYHLMVIEKQSKPFSFKAQGKTLEYQQKAGKKETRKKQAKLSDVMKSKVNLEFADTPLSDVLEALTLLTGMRIQVKQDVDVKQAVTYKAKDMQVREVLDKVLTPKKLRWRTRDDEVIVENE